MQFLRDYMITEIKKKKKPTTFQSLRSHVSI